MQRAIQLIVVILACLCLETRGRNIIKSVEEYEQRRQEVLNNEQDKIFGENVQLSQIEQTANEILMKAKHEEYDRGYEDLSQFNPAYHFFLRKANIERSEIFKIIKDMPKGAALHIHDTALLGGDYLLNITYREHLHICDVFGQIQFKFLKNSSQDNTCEWKLMKDVRNNQSNIEEFDNNLKKLFTIEVDDLLIENDNNYESWIKLNEVFSLITPFLTYEPVWEEYFYEALKQYRDDKIFYLEVRTTLPSLYDIEGNTYNEIHCAKSFKIAHDRFINNYPDTYGMRIIYAPHRSVEISKVENYINIAKQLKNDFGDFFAGFDLVGQEDIGRPLIDFISELIHVPDDIGLFYHAGETNWYGTSTDNNLVDAVLLGAKRIGHAYALIKHPVVSQLVMDKNIVIEVNPISNQVLGYVRDYRNHPAAALFAENYPLVISSDDPGLWGALPLSHDIYEAFMGIASRNSDIKFLKQLAINSIVYSSMPQHQMTNALEDFIRMWDNFILNLVQFH